MPLSPDPIDLRPVKREVARLYPVGHPLRYVVEQQPDMVPRSEGVVRLEMLVYLTFAVGKDRNLRCAT